MNLCRVSRATAYRELTALCEIAMLVKSGTVWGGAESTRLICKRVEVRSQSTMNHHLDNESKPRVENSPLEEDQPYVCKFREINENFLNLLPNLEIYIPTVAQLNDPLEGVLSEGYATDFSPLPTNSDVESYLHRVGVYSVSIHRKSWHASNFLPMWTSYANNHKGVCMVFKRKPLQDERFKWVNVDYVTHRDNDRGEQARRITPPTFTQDSFGNAQAKLSKKYDYWQHERELRLIAQPGSTGRQAMDQFFELNAMVFGFSAEQPDILKVLNQLPDDTKEKLLMGDDMGIFRANKPQPMKDGFGRLQQVNPPENIKPLLGLKKRLSFEWGAA
ncbi:DUF2971 domain-containing protein [Limnohabitans sp.]|uniref:DUF2971 domain-containing protein n=2 Tax=Limnohabitans sp. TaxID=1907725 RepID=UPI0025BA1921|nr:DUF2971 domain-containing protein [Limnohabitans sp.]